MQRKDKLEEYKRIHWLITQCSSRTIWEMLRTGKSMEELLDRVPDDFKDWAKMQIASLQADYADHLLAAHRCFIASPWGVSRKEFAEYAKVQGHPALLFALLDCKPINDMIWKLIEPKWTTPFRSDEG